MNEDRWTQIETLVEQALELPPEDRSAFINNQCGEDDALRKEVHSLLEHGDKALSFMGHFESDVVAPSIDHVARDQVDEDHRIDTQFGHYHITDILGRGGMGVVYKAKDTNLDRTVALKFLPSHLTRSDKDKQRFIREAKAAAALNHPNICTIHSVEEHEGQHFISMEYIDGQTLREKLESDDMTPKTALDYGIRIAEALAEAHEKGIVHRDIKPGNIMVDSKNRIKVMDFGLAKLVDSTPITQTGTTLGTMAYMSPEQIQGRPVDHRADLFSFGVLLFEMLTGQRPFGGQYDAALSYSIVNEEPPLLSDFLPDAPQKLSLLVSRLLEKDPAKRYSDSEQLAGELNRCLDQLVDSLETSQVTQSTFNESKSESFTVSDSASTTLNLPALRTRNGMLGLAGIVIVLALLGYWLLPSLVLQPTPTNNKIAVLPLESISTEPEDIQFTDGVHEELINRLAGISDLTVIARSSVLGFEPRQRDLQSIAQQLDVSSLMEGTVRRIGDQLRVSVQLIDANSLGTLWSGSFDENIDDVFEIQSRIARQVAGELQASLSQEEQQRLEQRPTENPQAYRLYMQGREYLGRTVWNQENLLAAEDLFQRALDLDPEFAQAWGMLAETYSRIYQFHGLQPDDLQKLEQAAEWALVYGPELPETYLANGLSLYWKHKNQQVLTYLETAVQKFPNDPMLLMLLSSTHRRLGNWEETNDYLKKRIQLDPLDQGQYTQLAFNFWLMRDYEEAMVYVDQVFELFPNVPFGYWIYSHILLSKDGTLDGFEQWWEQLRPLDPADVASEWWGVYNTLKRDWEQALRGFRNTDRETLHVGFAEYRTRTQRIAEILDYQGETEEARTHFNQLIDHLLEEMDTVEEGTSEIIRYRIELANAYARIGQVGKATQQMDRASELMRPFRQEGWNWPVFELRRAEFYTFTGQQELAIDKLEYLLSVPSLVHRNYLRINPRWDPLRDNPRFQELIAGEDKPYIEGL